MDKEEEELKLLADRVAQQKIREMEMRMHRDMAITGRFPSGGPLNPPEWLRPFEQRSHSFFNQHKARALLLEEYGRAIAETIKVSVNTNKEK